jgi:2-phosphoglycerate kinase
VTEPRRINPLPLGSDELGLPYSRGLMARSLMAAGVAGHRAYALASRVHDDLRERGQDRIELERLETLAVEVLGEEEGRESIRRLRRYQELREVDLPIMVFIGGATGTGKSTVATELAYRFGITRVTSTDFVRQTMRAFFSEAFMPAIHQSSFEAGDVYPDADEPLEYGFQQQARNVLVGVNASSERALQEGWSLVLEGVHLIPGMVELPRPELAVSVFVVLSIEDEEEHVRHFRFRDEDSDRRPESRYLERFADIRKLQEFVVARAQRAGVPVIENEDADKAARTVADLVLDAAEQSRTVAR